MFAEFRQIEGDLGRFFAEADRVGDMFVTLFVGYNGRAVF